MRRLAVACVMLALSLWVGDPAYAEVNPGDGDFIVTVTHGVPPAEGGDPGSSESSADNANSTPPPCNAVAIGVNCTVVTLCEPDQSMGTTHALHQYGGVLIHGWPYGVVGPCQSAQAGGPRRSLPALVFQAFRRVPLPEPALSIQPPQGKTLVGLETIFSTKAEPFTKTLTLLGRKVTLKIEPSSFVWHHGDGTSQTTDWAGKAWDHDSPDIDGYLTHVYEHTGAVRPSVEVTWSAQFRVGGGAWRPVNGTVTRTGAPVPLQILEGQPVLNSY